MKKRIFLIVIAVFIVLMGAWRMWPHSLKDILHTNGKTIDTISVYASEFGISDHSPNMDVYKLEITSPEDTAYGSLMSIIEGTAFRNDFRNMLPWDISTVGSGTENIAHAATVILKWGDSDDEVCYITFHGDRVASFSLARNTEILVYHPTKRTTLNQIVEYTKENGVLQE